MCGQCFRYGYENEKSKHMVETFKEWLIPFRSNKDQICSEIPSRSFKAMMEPTATLCSSGAVSGGVSRRHFTPGSLVPMRPFCCLNSGTGDSRMDTLPGENHSLIVCAHVLSLLLQIGSGCDKAWFEAICRSVFLLL